MKNIDSVNFSYVKTNVDFTSVAGLEEVKEELTQISDFLKNPQKYKKFNAKIPKGILLYGPPGTGKTLIARALAGETNASYIYSSGSEFIEKFVGIGASRIRTLFEKAKKKTPCIIFIDELDAIGISRSTDNNSERDQTLNQLLIELDGFQQNDGVIVLAATNRIDMLDKALLRPGRFDKHIYMPNPAKNAREQILSYHLKNKPVSRRFNKNAIISKTSGLSGAHIANIVNESALIAIKKNKKQITTEIMEEALIKATAGLENKSMVLEEHDKKIVSYHESAHALVSYFLTNNVPDKVTILPRSEALGFVLNGSDTEEKLLSTRQDLLNQITILLSGRAGEEIIFDEISTGAKEDLNKANEIASQMVCSLGMSKYKNKTFSMDRDFAFYDNINEEIISILDECYSNSKKILKENKELLKKIAKKLYKKEDLNMTEIKSILTMPVSAES